MNTAGLDISRKDLDKLDEDYSNSELEHLYSNLDPTHLAILELHLEGYSNSKIAEFLQCHRHSVRNVLNKPEIKAILNEINKEAKDQLKALKIKSVQILSNILKDGNNRERLASIKLVHEMTENEQDKLTAEDIISQIMQKVDKLQINQQINNTQVIIHKSNEE